MDIATLKATVYARLEAIAGAEKITRAELTELSRELLEYVPETDDVDIVNRLIGVLTPMNADLARLYFKAFLPWKVEQDAKGNFVRFGVKMEGDKKVTKKMQAITEWLANEENNIWTWGADNVEVKEKDLAGNVAKAVKAALKGHEKSGTAPCSPADVVNAMFVGGVTVHDLMAALEARMAEPKEEEFEPAH